METNKAYFIPAKGRMQEVRPKNGTDFSAKELNGFVGGYIEIVRTNDERFIVCNEEGRIHDLPLNITASYLNFLYGCGDHIVGDVLVCPKTMIK